MSALTRIFVLLVVVLSIIETAGTVVWVNRSENFVKAKSLSDATLRMQAAQVANLTAENTLLGGERTAIQQSMQRQVDDARNTINQLQASLTDKDTQIAQLNANLAQTTIAQKSATDALTVAQKTVDQQNTTIADLRKSETELNQKSAELSLALNSRTNQFEVVNRQERDDREQIAQLQNDSRKYQEAMHKAGISMTNSPAVNGQSMVPVAGVIRSAETIGGVPYATIDVGASSQVTQGMRFTVINLDPKATDAFLGYLIVERVEPRQAFGRLVGPRINEVRQGDEVRTQL